jgi:hypothetical protein
VKAVLADFVQSALAFFWVVPEISEFVQCLVAPLEVATRLTTPQSRILYDIHVG